MFFTIKKMKLSQKSLGVFIILLLVFIFMISYKPDLVPAPWFDEGWTLSVARNWIERGIYARFLVDQPISAIGMAWSIPVTGWIALSFKILGIGLLQGRIPGILFTVGSLGLLYVIAYRLYGACAGLTTLLISFLATTSFNPLLMGRQALGEPAMIFYLLLGYYLFDLSIRKSYRFLSPAMVFWGAGITAKPQALPFWILSILTAILLAYVRKQPKISFLTIIASLGSILVYISFVLIESHLESGFPLYGAPMQGLYKVTAYVPEMDIRINTLKTTLLIGFPTLFSLIYSFKKFYCYERLGNQQITYLEWMLLTLLISWLGWFAFLSVGWPRYFYPISFLITIFLGKIFYDLSFQFNFRKFVLELSKGIRKVNSSIILRSVLLLFLIIDGLVFNAYFLKIAIESRNESIYELIEYIHQITPYDAVIETYDSELIFLLDRMFHYPPDQIQVDLNQRIVYKTDLAINYDPLIGDPDYLIVGPFSRMWKLYEPIIKSNQFSLIKSISEYDVYQRVR